jgi:hypothetical protein
MLFFGMWRRVDIVLTDISEERIASIFRVERIETSVNIRSTGRHIQEDGILHSHRRENLKSYIDVMRFGHSTVNTCAG